jgi:regulator of replication initiation timing|tara:strand:+ start:2209 stop:2496 length:288 start_codon:yes stop_codon:yes gene_type:complete
LKESYLIIKDFKDNVRNLIEKVDNLKIENNKLSNDFNVLNTLYQNTIKDFDELKVKYDALKIGKAVIGSNEKNKTKRKLKKLIDQIDDCLVELTS